MWLLSLRPLGTSPKWVVGDGGEDEINEKGVTTIRVKVEVSSEKKKIAFRIEKLWTRKM